MIRSFLSLLIILLVTGCSPKLDDLHAYTQSVK
ncbi:pilus assembly protein PilP, partial [Pseudomonas sp. HMWF031]